MEPAKRFAKEVCRFNHNSDVFVVLLIGNERILVIQG